MPWYNSTTGELVKSPSDFNEKEILCYQPSMYAKEELPTWAEVYEEFYLRKIFDYDPDNPDHQDIDLYWKIPHRKFILATICNQFNKMIIEDGMNDEILDKLNNKLNNKVIKLRFWCYHDSEYFENIEPPIYTIPMPNGKPNPFITSIYNRSDITSKQYNQKIKIFPTIVYENPEKYKYDSDIFNLIIEVMIEQFKSYFAGDIGWKDSNGNLIEGDPSCRYCSTSGYLTK